MSKTESSFENHRRDLSKNQTLQHRCLGLFTVTKRITHTNYQIHNNRDPSVVKTVHRSHLVDYYPEKESLPAVIEEYVPTDPRHDYLY